MEVVAKLKGVEEALEGAGLEIILRLGRLSVSVSTSRLPPIWKGLAADWTACLEGRSSKRDWWAGAVRMPESQGAAPGDDA